MELISYSEYDVTSVLHFFGSNFSRKSENIQLRHTDQVPILFKVLRSEVFR